MQKLVMHLLLIKIKTIFHTYEIHYTDTEEIIQQLPLGKKLNWTKKHFSTN